MNYLSWLIRQDTDFEVRGVLGVVVDALAGGDGFPWFAPVPRTSCETTTNPGPPQQFGKLWGNVVQPAGNLLNLHQVEPYRVNTLGIR